jgi:hypothetical protein
MALVEQAADMGIRALRAHPRRGDISLESAQYIRLFAHARSLGLHTKTTSSCVSPDGLIALIPHIDQLTLSIDGFDASSFARFRPPWLLNNVLDVLVHVPSKHPTYLWYHAAWRPDDPQRGSLDTARCASRRHLL